MRSIAVLVALGLLAACAPAAVVVDPARVGAPGSGAPVELYRPTGDGPFPAVVVLHGCGGVSGHHRGWARRLVGWGYVAAVVDSFGPRGAANLCNRGREIPARVRAADAAAAAAYLRGRPDVRPDRVGVVGFSHGGWTVLAAVLADGAGAQPFDAAVAFYPACEAPTSPLVTDTLILIGEADDWTPAERCVRWRDTVRRGTASLELVVYPGALHAFDLAAPPHAYAGHWIGRDEAAAPAAIAATRAFLAARLGGADAPSGR